MASDTAYKRVKADRDHWLARADAAEKALAELIEAATSVVFPDGDHGAEQSALAKALVHARAALADST